MYSPIRPVATNCNPEKNTINVANEDQPAAISGLSNFRVIIIIITKVLKNIIKKPKNVSILNGAIEKLVNTLSHSVNIFTKL